jgi:hypothetical protein
MSERKKKDAASASLNSISSLFSESSTLQDYRDSRMSLLTV